jgi:D-alanyl-D-alanine carboxypeptidase (penicillin-binding protein 5/6)
MYRSPLAPIIAASLAAALAMASVAQAQGFETKAREALVIDDGTGMVMYEKNADQPIPPASMSKLMTLYMLFEALRDGRVTRETEFSVSARAQAMGGSRMFVEAGTSVPVEALIHGIIVQSGNDACVVVAEGLAGSEDTFAQQMTRRARELGMTASTFKNASGWPVEGHVMSARDLVTLSRHIIDDFPEDYAYFQETEFTWNGITQPNRNPLLSLGLGVDGLKTGHTQEAGYGLVGSAVQNGQRILFMAGGLGSEAERKAETESIVKWAFGAFDTMKFFDAGAEVAEADVWLGATPKVAMVAPKPLQLLVPREDRANVKARVVYNAPIEAPIVQGQKLGALEVDVPGHDPVSFDLVAAADVPRGGLLTRINAAARLTRDRALGYLPGRGEDGQ